MRSNLLRFIIVPLFTLVLVGCSLRLPRVKPPQIDASSAADGALAAFDADHDGVISRDESQACAGLRDKWQRYDQDGDDTVSREELEARFSEWTDGDTGLMNVRAEIVYRGRPLTEATVKLTPYDFLGENVRAAEGITDRYGFVFLAIPKDQLPSSQQGAHGMQIGLYRVSITHPDINLAPQYNRRSELSVDLSPADSNTGIRFVLK